MMGCKNHLSHMAHGVTKKLNIGNSYPNKAVS